MKAYMSELNTGAGFRSFTLTALWAEREARRILAETEPESPYAYAEAASPVIRARGVWRGIPRNLTAHEALAESLAAFVSGPVGG